MEHGALEPDEQPEQLREAGAVQGASRAVRSGVHREHIRYPRGRDLPLPPQLGPKHGTRRPPRRPVPEYARRGARGQAREPEEAAHPAPGGAAAGVGEHQVGVGAPPHQSQQRLDVRLIGGGVAPHHPLVLAQLHGHRVREAEPLGQELLGKLRQSVLDRRVEVLDRLQDGERDDAVDHGARNVARPHPIAEPGRTERGYGTP